MSDTNGDLNSGWNEEPELPIPRDLLDRLSRDERRMLAERLVIQEKQAAQLRALDLGASEPALTYRFEAER